MAPIPVSTRLRSAIMLDDVLLAKRIIRHNPAFLENPDFDDAANTSLHLAAMLGYVDMIKLLVKLGHDRCAPSSTTTAAAPSSASSRSSASPRSANFTSDHPDGPIDDHEAPGDDPFDFPPGISLNNDLRTPLHLAAAHAHPAATAFLARAFPHTTDWADRTGQTAMHLATCASTTSPGGKMAALALGRSRTGSGSSGTSIAASGTTYVTFTSSATSAAAAAAAAAAATTGTDGDDTSTLAALLRAGANTSPRDHTGNTPLHIASAWGNLKAFRLLVVAAGPAAATVRNASGCLPVDYALSSAAAKYCTGVVLEVKTRLLKAGEAAADVDGRGRAASTSAVGGGGQHEDKGGEKGATAGAGTGAGISAGGPTTSTSAAAGGPPASGTPTTTSSSSRPALRLKIGPKDLSAPSQALRLSPVSASPHGGGSLTPTTAVTTTPVNTIHNGHSSVREIMAGRPSMTGVLRPGMGGGGGGGGGGGVQGSEVGGG